MPCHYLSTMWPLNLSAVVVRTGVDILHLCNCSAVLLVGLLKLVGLYRARQAALRARQIGAAEPLVGL